MKAAETPPLPFPHKCLGFMAPCMNVQLTVQYTAHTTTQKIKPPEYQRVLQLI